MRIYTFDTTLRDGTQGEAVSFSVDDKLLIAQKLDEFGIDYIEGGWPGSNPKDKEFFARAKDLRLRHAKLTAFGATRLARNPVHADASVLALVEAETPVVAVFGKTWDFHVRRALGIELDENLVLVADTVAFLKSHGREVVYDAEHFFDGYIANPDYALKTLEAAHTAVKKDDDLKRFYQHLVQRRGRPKAKTAAARKLLIRAYIMLRDEIDYAEFRQRAVAARLARLRHGPQMPAALIGQPASTERQE